jgi:predicted DCC family thiol-disulfide oxidoreductase YuxK
MPGLPRYTVFYDANCRLCVRSRRTLERLRPRAKVTFVDLRDEGAMRGYPMVRRAGLSQMFVMDSAGEVAGGYDGFVLMAPVIPWVRGMSGVLRWRAVRAVGRVVYRWVARHRYALGGAVSCEGGACAVTPDPAPPRAP